MESEVLDLPIEEIVSKEELLPDLRSHLVFSMMVIYGFFKEDNSTKKPRKLNAEKFNKTFFLQKLTEAENYVHGFLNFKKKNEDYDHYLNVCGLSYAKKIMKLDVPDESNHRTYLIKEIQGRIPNKKSSLRDRLESMKIWIGYAKYEI